MEKVLEILEKDNRATIEQMSVMLDKNADDVKAYIEKAEKDNIILKYHTIVNWEKTSKQCVTALIEIKVSPQRGEGFDKIAEKIYRYPQVTSVYLMSGGFDLTVIVEGKTMKDVALFISETLAPMEQVLSTSTHFLLKRYKDYGVIFDDAHPDERQVITL